MNIEEQYLEILNSEKSDRQVSFFKTLTADPAEIARPKNQEAFKGLF